MDLLWNKVKLYLSTEWQPKENKQKQMIALKATCIAFTVVCFIMSIINFVVESYFMMFTTALIGINFALFFFFLSIIKKDITLQWGCTYFLILIAVIFTYYLVTGGENGFSCIWILLVPVTVSLILGNLYGVIIGFYFLIAVFVCFWSPVKELLPYDYSETYLKRFPIVYLSNLILSYITSYRIFVYEYAQVKNQDVLKLAVKNEHEKVEQLTIQVIQSICNTVDARDSYTKQHSMRVALYSAEIARRLGWTPTQVTNLYNSALLHDIGKIGVPDEVLKKHGSLTEEEYAKMKEHVIIGGEILKDITTIEKVAEGAKYHHERFDGKGYACGLKGEEIPIEARIIGISDAVDAMYSTRVYRGKQDINYIAKEVKEGKGTQFDDKLTEIMLAMIEDGFLEKVAVQEE